MCSKFQDLVGAQQAGNGWRWLQGGEGEDRSGKTSSLIISEFVGCSPSMSGAIRVNPWSVDSVADGIYSAIKMSKSGDPRF